MKNKNPTKAAILVQAHEVDAIVSQPTHIYINKLTKQLIQVAASIPTLLRGRMHWHTGVVLTATKYAVILTTTTTHILAHSGVHPTTVDNDPTIRSRQEKEHEARLMSMRLAPE